MLNTCIIWFTVILANTFFKTFLLFLAPRHMKGFCENPEVVNAFKAAALGRPVNLPSSTGMYIYKFDYKL